MINDELYFNRKIRSNPDILFELFEKIKLYKLEKIVKNKRFNFSQNVQRTIFLKIILIKWLFCFL